MLEVFAVATIGYLCGSVASAIIVCRLLGLPDPRAGGSGNPGATNVLRLGGKGAAALTLAGDVLKGALPVALARMTSDDPLVAAGGAIGAFVGHLYPVFFRFRGGKGVATTFGAVATLFWPVGLGMGVVWVAVAAASRYASLASIAAALSAPILAVLLAAQPAHIGALTLIGTLLIWRHRDNVARVRAGTENRIGTKASTDDVRESEAGGLAAESTESAEGRE